jgi:alpha-beta hydrolase superfamily lysophospholipase
MPWRETAAELDRARAEVAVTVPSPAGALFGVFTPPDPTAPQAEHCVILFTRPRSHRNRIWVEAARRLAVNGFAAFRFDYHGTGDSEGASAYLDPNAPYLDDASAVIRFLGERFGQRRFLSVGACYDARVALGTFADPGSGMDGMVFFSAPVMELTTLVKAYADHKDWRHLMRALGNPENWRQLGNFARWRYMLTVLGRVARRGNARRDDTPLAGSFVEHFRALARSGARALFVYGDADEEYLSFQAALATEFPKLTAEQRARLEVEVWEVEDVHGFLNIPIQRRSLERALGWLGAFHPTARSGSGAAWPSVSKRASDSAVDVA